MATTPSHRARVSNPADTPALSDLIEHTIVEYLGDVLPPGELDACVRDYSTPHQNERCFVVEGRDGKLVGYAVESTDVSSESGLGPIRRLYVRSAPDGHDVAEALVEAMRHEGELADSPASEDAMAAYDRWGFVDVELFRLWLSLPGGQGRVIEER